ncbi:unnamed protein product [Symbiodinium sp. CCMP2592]|nr:unnamed protein product [Symbiodinium sp. CCMP2592]
MVAMRFLLAWPLLVQGLQQAHFSFLHVSPDSLASSSTTGVCSDANLLNAAKLRALVEVSRSFNDTTPLDEVLDVIARMHQLRKHMVLPQPAANVASIAAAPAQLRSMALKAAAPEPQMVHVLMGWLSLDAILMLVTLVVALAIALAAVLSCLRASREEMRAAYAQIDAVKAEARETLRVMASRFAALQAMPRLACARVVLAIFPAN